MTFPGEKLVIKLWETLVEKGIGSALLPYHEKRMGNARNAVRRQELLMLAEAEKTADLIRADKARLLSNGELEMLDDTSDISNASISERIEPTISLETISEISRHRERTEWERKEINSSKAILIAEEILANDSQDPKPGTIDDDWLYSWRECAGNVSSEELQDLWGRVLAGEIKSPGSFSLRTLEFIKSLSRPEAELISKTAKFVVSGRIIRDKEKHLEESGIDFDSLLLLQEIGVITGVDSVGLNSTFSTQADDRYFQALISQNKVILIEHDDKNRKISLPTFILTRTGQQVLNLASFEADIEYLRSIAKDLAKQGYIVKLADWIPINANSGQFRNPQIIEA